MRRGERGGRGDGEKRKGGGEGRRGEGWEGRQRGGRGDKGEGRLDQKRGVPAFCGLGIWSTAVPLLFIFLCGCAMIGTGEKRKD